MIKKILTTTMLLVGVAAGIYLTGIGILLQAWDESMLRFDQQPTTSSYLWWGVSAFGLALIVACARVGIRSLRGRSKGADVRWVHGSCE